MARAMGLGWLVLASSLGAPLGAEDGASSAPITLPSGQEVSLMEARVETAEGILRLRYLAPDIGSPMTRPAFDKLTQDLEFLCAQEGLRTAEAEGLDAPQIIVSLSAEPVEFGVISSDVTQVFEAFVVENGSCMLEMF